MLEVGIEDDQNVRGGDARSCDHRFGLAEVPAMPDDTGTRAKFRCLGNRKLERRVGRTIIDDDDLAIERILVERGSKGAEERRNIIGLVVGRHDDGKAGWTHLAPAILAALSGSLLGPRAAKVDHFRAGHAATASSGRFLRVLITT